MPLHFDFAVSPLWSFCFLLLFILVRIVEGNNELRPKGNQGLLEGSQFGLHIDAAWTTDGYLAYPLCSKAWKGATFKDYNFSALGLPPSGGSLHPLLKASPPVAQQTAPSERLQKDCLRLKSQAFTSEP